MPGTWRIAHIEATWIDAVLILEHTVKYEKLLTACMYMPGKRALRSVPHDGGCASDLVSDAVQHPPLDTGDRRGGPWQACRMNGGTLAKIGM
jgi:hypothetical protein